MGLVFTRFPGSKERLCAEDKVPKKITFMRLVMKLNHDGYLGSNSIKWIGDLTNAVLVDSFLQN